MFLARAVNFWALTATMKGYPWRDRIFDRTFDWGMCEWVSMWFVWVGIPTGSA